MKKQLIILDLDLNAVKPTVDDYIAKNPNSEFEFIVCQSEGLWSKLEKKQTEEAIKQARQLINQYKPHIIVSNGFQEVDEQVKIFKKCSDAAYVGNSSIRDYNLIMLGAGADAIFAKDYKLDLPRNEQVSHSRGGKHIRGMDPDFILWMIDNYDSLIRFEKPERVVKMRANCLISHYDKPQKSEEVVKEKHSPKPLVEKKVLKPWWKFW
jgi:hypothetical protein